MKLKRGPKTEAGRAAVRLNPVKHAVLSQTPVIPLVEREEDWRRLRTGIFEYFAAEGMMEEALADQIAMLVWRRHRLVRFETESIVRYLEEVPGDYRRMVQGAGEGPRAEDVERMDAMLSARLMPGTETAEKIMRYETRLHRFLLQTIHQLLVLQGMRKAGGGRPSPATWSAGDDRRVSRGPRPRRMRRLEGYVSRLAGPTAGARRTGG